MPYERSEALLHVVHAGLQQREPVKDGLEILARLGASFARLAANLRQDLRGDVGHAVDFTTRQPVCADPLKPVAVGRKEGRHGRPAFALKRYVELPQPSLDKLLLGPDDSLLESQWICGVHQLVLVIDSL